MDAEKYFDQVSLAIAESEEFFSGRRTKEKRRAFYSSLSVSIAAAVSTFAVGLGVALPRLRDVTTVVALGGGAVTSVLAAYETHWDYKGLWGYRTHILFLIQQLQRSMSSYVSQLSPGSSPDPTKVLEFERRHEEIRELDIKGWGRLRHVEFPQVGKWQ